MSMYAANISAESLILSDIKCMYCGKSIDSLSYNCACHPRPEWQNRYRSTNVKFFYSDNGKALIRDSVFHYLFDHPRGMRQYAMLPLRSESHPKSTLTGLGPLHRLSNLSFRYGADLYLKNEFYNPTHTTLDREMQMCALHARKKHRKRAVFYGTASAAASAAAMAAKLGIKLLAVLPASVGKARLEYLGNLGADVVSLDASPAEVYHWCAALNAERVFADAGCDNWSVVNPFRVQGQKSLAVEILNQLSSEPDKFVVPHYVVVPVTHGSNLIGIWKGFQELKELGLIYRLPRMVAVGLKDASPICKAVNLQQIMQPQRCQVEPSASPELNEYILDEAFDSVEAARVVILSGGMAVEVTERELHRVQKWLSADEEDLIHEEPALKDRSSLLALAALEQLKERGSLEPWQKVVTILPGNPFPAEGTGSPYPEEDVHTSDSDVLEAPVRVGRGRLRELSSGREGLAEVLKTLMC